MQYSLSTLRRKAHEADYSFQKGYQRYNHDGWGYVRACDGERIVGYQILDYRTNFWFILHTVTFMIMRWVLMKRHRF